MPLFQRKFSSPKFQQRKSGSLSNLSTLDDQERRTDISGGPIRAHLGNQDLIFQDGRWIVVGGSVASPPSHEDQHVRDTRKENQRLLEENNLLRLKIDILLDLLSETTAEVKLQENEIDNLRALTSNRR